MRRTPWTALLMLLAYLPACTSYVAMDDPAAELQPSPKPMEQVRVTTRQGESVVLYSPVLRGDSLWGVYPGGEQRGIPMADVSEVDALRPNGLLTAGLIAGLGLAFVGIAGAISMGDMWED